MNNEPDMSAANSPAADQMEMGSPSPEANPDDDIDEGGEVEETCETDSVGICEDSGQEEDTKLAAVDETMQVRKFPLYQTMQWALYIYLEQEL